MAETILNDISSLDGLLERLSPEPHLRGEEFERATKWFLETDPAYSSELRQVWLWRDWPGRWGPDIGIDLVAETQEGKLWAIQVKCYDPENQVPTSEIDSFISASSRPEFDHRLLVSTGQLSKNAEYKLAHQEKSTAFLLHHHLNDSIVDWLAYLDESLPSLPDKKSPRPHQQKAIDDVIEGFATNDRGQLIMACGTGKTLIGTWIAESLGCSRVLVLMPSLSLVSQIAKEWLSNSKEPFVPLFVCSDETVTDDTFISTPGELGQPVTTNPEVIKQFLTGPGKRVVFSTYQSSPRIAEAQVSAVSEFDLIVADEAHHCAGAIDSAFAEVLDSNKLKSKHRLFMTATPRYLSSSLRRKADESDLQITSMDDLDKFGPEFHVLTFGQAISLDLLSDYQVLILGITDTEVSELTQNRRFVELLDSELISDAESLAYTIGLLKAIRDHDLRFLLTFHNRVSKAKNFAALMEEVNEALPVDETVPGLWTGHVSGSMASRERQQIMQRFRSGAQNVNLLSNARCLGEGVDIPDIDGIGFIDPRKSTVDIVQAVGRAIRKSDHGTIGTIVIPVFIDQGTGQSDIEQLDESRFRAIWDVLKALRAHDEVLAGELDSLRNQLGRRGCITGFPPKIVIDIPIEVGTEFVDAIQTHIVRSTTPIWEFWYGLLEKFAETEGHSRPPQHYKTEDGFNLGNWLNTEVSTRRHLLSAEQVVRLESLPKWTWDPMGDAYSEGFRYLEQYVEQEGHARPPGRYLTEDGFRLGRWVSNRRLDSTLSQDRIEQLERLPGWAWDTRDYEFGEGFAAFQIFVEREGHANPSLGHNELGVRLGAWVERQREVYDGLKPEQISQLESIPGWTWEATQKSERWTNDPGWEEAFAALQRYAAREEHARPPHRHQEDGLDRNLGSWVVKQRMDRRSLTPDQRSRLENLPGWAWDTRDYIFEQNFMALQKFVEQEGHASPNQRWKEGEVHLGKWVMNLRRSRTKLSEDRISRLESLPGWQWVAKK